MQAYTQNIQAYFIQCLVAFVIIFSRNLTKTDAHKVLFLEDCTEVRHQWLQRFNLQFSI